MPSSAAVHEQLTRIIVQVVGCEPGAVVPTAKLVNDLEVDSLSIVEIVEALGLAFDIYIPDETVNDLRSVQDAINAVVHHDPATRTPTARSSAAAAGLLSARPGGRPLPADEIELRKRTAWKFAGWFAVAGLAIGAALGLGGAVLINATGLKGVSMPPVPTPSVTSTPTPTPTPTPSGNAPTADNPAPTLTTTNTDISPGEKLRLSGSFPELDKGATLQVQIKDKGGVWEDFPITTKTGDGGAYTTIIYTTRTGERQIRMLHKATDTKSPVIMITVGGAA